MIRRLLGLAALSLALAAPRTGHAADRLSQAEARFASLDGLKVRYKLLGQGEPALVFVHGWICSLEFWSGQASAFAATHRVLLVDLPGHGGSDKPQVDYTMELFARGVLAAMRDAGIEKAVLVGHSMGAPVVRQLYRLFPQKAQALVTVDGSLRAYFQDPAQLARFAERYRGADWKANTTAAVDGMLAPGMDKDLRGFVRAEMLKAPQHVVLGGVLAMGDAKIYAPDPIGVPLLAVHAKSPYWSADYEAFVRSLNPKVDYRVMEGVSHFLMLEKPEAFNALLAGFLAAQGWAR